MVVTDESLGSGSIVSRDDKIITNWHGVRGFEEIGVRLKPASEGGQPSCLLPRGLDKSAHLGD
jgi:S1-C subfamily serine protease